MKEIIMDHRDIKIKAPFEFVKLMHIEIHGEFNEHVSLHLEGVIPSQKRDEYVLNSKSTDIIKVEQFHNNVYLRTLFSGKIVDIETKVDMSQSILTVNALSHTYDMDIEKKRRSYQEPSMQYSALISSVIKSYNKPDYLMTKAKGSVIDIFTLQYDETDWDFLKRMASRFETVLVPDGREDSPKFWFGPPQGNYFDLKPTKYKLVKKVNSYREAKYNHKNSVKEDDFAGYEIETTEYMYIGDNVNLNGLSMKVAAFDFVLTEGILLFRYYLKRASGLRNHLIKNNKIIGLNLEGKVIGREANKIKIKLDIDKNNPDCGTRWFKYECDHTVGSDWGWYVMPEMDHFVSLYHPDNLEKNAYSIVSVRRNGDFHPKTQDPRIKILGTHHYKEWRMDNEQLKITTKDDKTGQMYIKMHEESGIDIISDKDILFKTKNDLNVLANEIEMKAADGIYFVNEPGSIIMNGTTEFNNTIIDRKTTTEKELKLMDSKKAAIYRSIAGYKTLGEKYRDTVCGDPVDISSGNYFIEHTDMIIQGVTPIVFSRVYNALDEYKGGLGTNWHHKYDMKLIASDTSLELTWFDGRQERFHVNKKGEFISENDGEQFIKKTEDGKFELDGYNKTKYVFDKNGYLESVYNKGNGFVSLSYNEKNELIRISNRCGSIKLSYSSGRISKITDALGRFVEYKYENNALVRVRNINGGITNYEYDNDFQITKVIDPNKNEMVKNIYDSQGRVILQTMSDGSVVKFEYNDIDRKVTFTDRNDIDTIYIKDTYGRIIEKIYTDGSEKILYGTDSRQKTFIDKMGGSYTYEFGEEYIETNPLGDTTSRKHDKFGNLLYEKFPDGSEHNYFYNDKNQLERYVDQEGYETNFYYDKNDNLSKIVSPTGSEDKFEYDSFGNIIRYIDGEEKKYNFRYDSVNRLVEKQKPLQNRTQFEYNEIDKITKIVYPNNSMVLNDYDKCGLLKKSVDEAGGEILYFYNSLGKVIKKIDARGFETLYDYDLMGNLISIKNPDGSEIIYRYNEENLLSLIEDEIKGKTHYFYDPNANLIKEINPLGYSTKYVYDSINRMVKKIDACGNETSYEYRYDGKVLKTTNSEGGIIENEYNKRGELISITNEAGAKTSFEYDADGRLIKKINPYGEDQEYFYNKNGKLVKIDYPDGCTESMEYDDNSNPIAFINAEGNKTLYEYDEMDRVISITNVLGGKKQIAYDPCGRVSSVKDENGASTFYDYDLNGNLSKLTDALNNSVEYNYDAMNRLTGIIKKGNPAESIGKEIKIIYRYNQKGLLAEEIDAREKITFYSYDNAGNLICKEDRDGYKTQYEYDAINNLSKIKYGDDKNASYKRDSLGRVIEVLDWTGATSFELDILGRIIKSKDPQNKTVSYEWGLMNEKKKIKYPDGTEVNYEYEGGRLKKVTGNDAEVTYICNEIGMITDKIFSNGIRSELKYDKLGHIVELKNYNGSDITDLRRFEYDNVGNKIKANIITKKSVLDHSRGACGIDKNLSFEYDSLNRLTQVSDRNSGNLEKYQYDSFGNRIKKTGRLDRREMDISYSYDENNRLLSINGKEEILGQKLSGTTEFEYDNRGNMLRIKNDAKNIGEYIYDQGNRLIKATTGEGSIGNFLYDGLGRRMKKEINGKVYNFVSDINSPYNETLEFELENAGTYKYFYGSGMFAASEETDGIRLMLTDEMGSIMRSYSESGDRLIDYNVFGKREIFGEKNIDDASGLSSFTGYEADGDLGLQFVQARYYMPDIGRFVSEDTNKGDINDIRSLNWYVHCFNNPLVYVDKDGNAAVYLRDSIEKLGGTVGWNADTQSATVSYGGKEHTFVSGVDSINVAGRLSVDSDILKDKLGLDYNDKDEYNLAFISYDEGKKFLKTLGLTNNFGAYLRLDLDKYQFNICENYLSQANENPNLVPSDLTGIKYKMNTYDSKAFHAKFENVVLKKLNFEKSSDGVWIYCNCIEKIGYEKEKVLYGEDGYYINQQIVENTKAQLFYSHANATDNGSFYFVVSVENVSDSIIDFEILKGAGADSCLWKEVQKAMNIYLSGDCDLSADNRKFTLNKGEIKFPIIKYIGKKEGENRLFSGVYEMKTNGKVKISVFISSTKENYKLSNYARNLDKYMGNKYFKSAVYSGRGEGYELFSNIEMTIVDDGKKTGFNVSPYKVINSESEDGGAKESQTQRDGIVKGICFETGNHLYAQNRSKDLYDNINHNERLTNEELIPIHTVDKFVVAYGKSNRDYLEYQELLLKEDKNELKQRISFGNIANWCAIHYFKIKFINDTSKPQKIKGHLIPAAVSVHIKYQGVATFEEVENSDLLYSSVRKATDRGRELFEFESICNASGSVKTWNWLEIEVPANSELVIDYVYSLGTNGAGLVYHLWELQ